MKESEIRKARDTVARNVYKTLFVVLSGVRSPELMISRD